MTAWEIIRKHLVDGRSTPGTVGRMVDLQRAGDLYFALREHLGDQDWQDGAFSKDEELTAALTQTDAIETLREVGPVK